MFIINAGFEVEVPCVRDSGFFLRDVPVKQAISVNRLYNEILILCAVLVLVLQYGW
jgi:hypothetical protein